jgi:hypothetical protein
MGGGSTRGESLKLDTTYMTSQLKVDNMEMTNSSLKIDSGNLKGGQPHYGHLTQNWCHEALFFFSNPKISIMAS